MNKNLKKKKKGFTLVEVIIVLAIIAIIAAIAVPNLTKVRQESKKKADAQSMETISRTINMLITDGSIEYSTTASSTITISGSGSVTIGTGATTTVDISSYFKGVKAPQEEGKNNYVITIESDGEIKCETN